MGSTEPTELSRWFDRYAPGLALYARQWLGGVAADDAVQEVFIRLMAQRAAPLNVKAWLFRSVRNAAISRVRSRRRRESHERRASACRPDWFESRPDEQSVLIYWIDHYNITRDEIFKWFALPYWQANKGVDRAYERLDKLVKDKDDSIFLGATFLPALSRAHYLCTRLDRRIATLRCIEAIRIHAAGHGGGLPASLSDINEVPIPLDPVTGKAFEYRLEGDKAVLQWTTPTNDLARYELMLAK
jgi:DNA-directed RNA polymerase specialized sigma24 family protein